MSKRKPKQYESRHLTVYRLKRIRNRVSRLTERTSAESVLKDANHARQRLRLEQGSACLDGRTALSMIGRLTNTVDELTCILEALIKSELRARGEKEL